MFFYAYVFFRIKQFVIDLLRLCCSSSPLRNPYSGAQGLHKHSVFTSHGWFLIKSVVFSYFFISFAPIFMIA